MLVLEVLCEEQTVNEIASKHELSPVMLSRWKAEFLERASTIFVKKTLKADVERDHIEITVKRQADLLSVNTMPSTRALIYFVAYRSTGPIRSGESISLT